MSASAGIDSMAFPCEPLPVADVENVVMVDESEVPPVLREHARRALHAGFAEYAWFEIGEYRTGGDYVAVLASYWRTGIRYGRDGS